MTACDLIVARAYALETLERRQLDGPSATVYIVEGEKDVDRLWDLGLVATCNNGGAGQWESRYAEWLTGRTVVILPDNDELGSRHAAQVAQSLHG